METTLPAPRSSNLRPGRIVAAAVVGLIAVGVLAIGIAGVSGAKQDHGYFASGTHRYTSNGYAIASDSLHVGSVPNWLVAKIRIASSSADGKPTFVGIARKADVDRYLARTAHSSLQELDFDPFDVAYATTAGSVAPARPDTQSFWAASSEGPGTQTVSWKIRSGHWRVVVMNADASKGVAANASVGGSIWNPRVLALILLGSGILLVGLAAAILVRPGKDRRIVLAKEASAKAPE